MIKFVLDEGVEAPMAEEAVVAVAVALEAPVQVLALAPVPPW